MFFVAQKQNQNHLVYSSIIEKSFLLISPEGKKIFLDFLALTPFSCLFQTSMDLPPDKAKLLKQYDDEKKWDIICDQVSRLKINGRRNR